MCFVLFGATDSRGPFQLWVRWFPTKDRLTAAREVRRAAAEFSDAPALSAWSALGPQVCHRPRYMALRCGTKASTWVEWAGARLLPGTIILIPTENFPEECGERPLVRGSGRAERVYRGRMIEAWRWPLDAPPPGTDQARAYASGGLQSGGLQSTAAEARAPRSRREAASGKRRPPK
jgi:hypothetical protein